MKRNEKKHVLLIECKPRHRRTLSSQLEARGYDIVPVGDGTRACRVFREQLPSLVLADVSVPGLHVQELIKVIKQDRPDSEVILITGQDDQELGIEALRQGACDVLTKPVNEDLLDIALGRAEEKIALREELQGYADNLDELAKERSARLIQAERAAAACQVMDRFFSAMSTLTENADEGELSLFNEMPCYISLHSPDLEIMDTNQLFEKTFGNLLREPSWAIYAQRGNGDTDCPVKRTFQAETGQRSRELIRTRREQLAPVEVHTLPFPGGDNCEDMVLELCVDLSRMEELRNTLAETQHHYQQLFDEVPCYISVLDEDLRVRAANKRFKEDFGDPAGGCCYRVFKQREAPCTDCPALMTFEDGLPRQSESAVQTRDGAMRNVLISTTPLKDAQGGVAQVMEVSTDITRIRELQDHLTSLGLLLGSVSHEMKNLLTLTDGGSYKVEAGLARGDLERIQQGWQTVTHTLGRIKKMVLDILLYAKKPEIEKAPVKASELAEDAVGQVRPRLDEHGLCLDLSLADPSWEVLVDRDTIHSALTNILENAVDACLSAPRTDRPSIALSVRACDQGQTIFEIADNGVGLDPECRNNLFTLFYTSKGRKGTGLGLFVAKHIVDQHGGSIEVDSSPGQGSVFRVALP